MNVTPADNILDGLSNLSMVKAQESVEKISSWSDAVTHTKARIKELRDSLRVFEQRVKRGDPWPGTQAENQTTESCHSV